MSSFIQCKFCGTKGVGYRFMEPFPKFQELRVRIEAQHQRRGHPNCTQTSGRWGVSSGQGLSRKREDRHSSSIDKKDKSYKKV